MHPSPTRARTVLTSMAVVAALAGLLGGCAPAGTGAAVAHRGADTGHGTADVDPISDLPAGRTEVGCFDITTSVAGTFVESAREWYARRIAAAVTGAGGDMRFEVRLTGARSYTSEAALFAARIPAVPAAPPPPALPENPFSTAEREDLTQAHQAAITAWETEVDRAREVAAVQADAVRALPLTHDDRGTDVLGCVIKAGERLVGTDRPVLIVATDLVATGPQQSVAPDLRGVSVILAFWCTDDAVTCTNRRDSFRSLVTAAGASQVEVLDPLDLTEGDL